MNYLLYLNITEPRPDFRLVCTWVTQDLENVDTEGDSHNPASREWTNLYLADRKNNAWCGEINKSSDPINMWTISASTLEFAAFLAIFLKDETNCEVWLDSNKKEELDRNALIKLIENFDITESINRTANSIWRKSTLVEPYPNLL
ncbi:hypothetical protein K6119_04135 [Paracrocinitomix mangrovi]|uniref:hypothetical protein n=1 Tax=Paracrocinitomix mangrovi TaxID=2862509 RepID=UPI001C8DD7B1|nr:hypothetical protein [Paracrocinitomix mangrovi]UKN02702.1 hypothetical protein K6119_04135 [Paracrocinitomix mangrovi]